VGDRNFKFGGHVDHDKSSLHVYPWKYMYSNSFTKSSAIEQTVQRVLSVEILLAGAQIPLAIRHDLQIHSMLLLLMLLHG